MVHVSTRSDELDKGWQARSMTKVRSIFFLIPALSLALSGCTEDTKEQSPEEPESGAYVAPELPEDDLPEHSPFETLFADTPALSSALLGTGSPQVDQDNKNYEAAIATCMSGKGFNYTPVDYSTRDTKTEGQIGNLTYAKEHGYGIVDGLNETPFTDPNQAMLDAMSPEERQAYDSALWGDFSQSGDQKGQGSGCTAVAQEQVWNTSSGDPLGPVWEDTEWSSLFDEMVSLGDLVLTDSRLDQKSKEWSKCMHQQGFDGFRSPPDAVASASSKALEMANNEAGEPSANALQEIRNEEVNLAVLDAGCREQTGYTDTASRVEYAIQQQFIDENKEQLDAMIAAIRAAEN